MTDRDGIFAGDNPFSLFKDWLALANEKEVNDPNAVALSTVDKDGLPNVRIVLLKDILDDAFVFYTNYNSTKSMEIEQAGKAAFVIHWKTLRRQIRVRGVVERTDSQLADSYFATRSVASRIGAWASNQSQPLIDRAALKSQVDIARSEQGNDPARPPFWGGFSIKPLEIEFWADGANRLHDRFVWSRGNTEGDWAIQRLNP